MQGKDYRGLIGKLIYLAISTRPDMAFIAHTLSCFVNNTGKKHWTVAKRVLRYLKQTIDMELNYKKDSKGIQLTVYSDADWGGT